MPGMRALRRVSVAVIDDNAQMRTIVGTVLTAAGIGRLYYAPDGRRGLDLVRETRPDIVYVDYEMPGMKGPDFISAVRAPGSVNRFLPIVMLTGHADLIRLCKVRDRGVTEFLVKPVTARDILRRLDTVILHPRPFVDCRGYFGPDRRRRIDPDYAGRGRRASDSLELGC